MQCPHDNHLLAENLIGNFGAQACPHCKGVWISYQILQNLYSNGLIAVPSQVYAESPFMNVPVGNLISIVLTDTEKCIHMII